MIDGYRGAYQRAVPDASKPETAIIGSSTAYVKSLHLLNGCILIDGSLWMPLESGAITAYRF